MSGVACEGQTSYDCKLGTCHGLPQCGTCCKCLGRCYIEMGGVVRQEPEAPKPEGVPPGTTVNVKNQDMIEPWIGATVMVKFSNQPAVPAKILEVNETSTKVIVMKEVPKA